MMSVMQGSHFQTLSELFHADLDQSYKTFLYAQLNSTEHEVETVMKND